MLTPILSASNSCCREKLAIVSLVFASASAVGVLIAAYLGDDAGRRGSGSHLPCLILATGGVLGQHVRHLMAQHRGQLGSVAGERDQAARHIELAGGQIPKAFLPRRN